MIASTDVTILSASRDHELADGGGVTEPKIESLRTDRRHHMGSFTDQRDAIARHMVALSTYLGHSNIWNTYWYLEATPALLTDIASACARLVHGGA